GNISPLFPVRMVEFARARRLSILPHPSRCEQALMSSSREIEIPSVQSGAGVFALGLGLTNECNLACAFCYRDASRVDRLTLDQVRAVMERLRVRSVNLGTGENGLHPQFLEIVRYLRAQPIKLTMTTNGFSVASISDAELAAFKDIEFSLDYATEAE